MVEEKENDSININFQSLLKREKLVAFAIFLIVAIIFLNPLLKNIQNWGDNLDFDITYSRLEADRISVQEYGQFPFWNPYMCGGTVAFTHPHVPFFPINWIPILIFGTIAGMKIGFFIYYASGMLGMYLLLRHLNTTKSGAYLGAFTFMLSGFFTTRLAVGLDYHMSAAYIPWIFFFYNKAKQNSKYLVALIISLSMLFVEQTAYMFVFAASTLALYSIIEALVKKEYKYLKIIVVSFIFVIGLTAFKLLPLADAYDEMKRESPINEKDGYKLTDLPKIFLNSVHAKDGYDANSYRMRPEMELWHEYSNYIGILPFLLFILGIIFFYKDRNLWPYLIPLILILLISMGPQAPINIAKILHMLPVFSSQRNLTRWLIVATFFISILGAFSLDRLKQTKINLNQKKIGISKIAPLIVIIVLINLFLVNSPVLKQAFAIEPREIQKGEFSQTGNKFDWPWNFNVWKSTLANKGMLQYNVESYCKTEALQNKSIQPEYNVIEYEYIKSNGNHRPVLFFNNNQIQIVWLIGAEIDERLNEKWYMQGQETKTVPFVYDAENKIQTFGYDATHKILILSENVRALKITGDEVDISLQKADSSYKNKFEKRGRIFKQANTTILFFEGAYLQIDKVLVDEEKDVSVTVFENNIDITRKPNPAYKGEAYFKNSGIAKITKFSPNSIMVETENDESDVLLINQNYFSGWRAKIDGKSASVKSDRGLISVDIPGGSHSVEIYFRPGGFVLGMIISIATLILLTLLFVHKKTSKGIRKVLNIGEDMQ